MIPSDESPPLPAQAPVQIYQFHVLLVTISPAIWRRFLIRSDSSIADLHYILQIVMGWDDEHLHQFTIQVGITVLNILAVSTSALIQRKSTCAISILE
jgi:hypothetical protein